MNKMKRVWNFLLMLLILAFGLILVWFFARVPFGWIVDKGNESNVVVDEGQGESEEGMMDMEVNRFVGNIAVLNVNDLVIDMMDGTQMTFKIVNNTSWQVLQPEAGIYVDIDYQDVKVGSPVVVLTDVSKDEYEAEYVLIESVTVLPGVLDRIDGNVLILLDYAGVEYQAITDVNTVVFEYGKGIVETGVDGLQVGQNILIYSNDSLDGGNRVLAESIELITIEDAVDLEVVE